MLDAEDSYIQHRTGRKVKVHTGQCVHDAHAPGTALDQNATEQNARLSGELGFTSRRIEDISASLCKTQEKQQRPRLEQ